MSRRIFHLGQLELVWQNDAAERLAVRLTRKSRPAIYDAASNWYETWYFNIRLEEEILRSRRYEHEMALLAFEFSGLGGPLSPERMDLQSVLRGIVQESLRQTDLPGIIDLDQYVVCLPQTDIVGANIVANRISNELRRYSVQFGIALYPNDGLAAEQLIAKALSAARKTALEQQVA